MRHFLSARIQAFKNWPEEEKHIRIDPPGERRMTALAGWSAEAGARVGNIADVRNENTE